MTDDSTFKWSDEHAELLISWRTDNVDLFTGKRNAAVKGHKMFVVENDLQGTVQPAWVKKKWENLKQKYKSWNTVERGRHCCSQEIPDTLARLQIPVSRLWAIISCFILLRLHHVTIVHTEVVQDGTAGDYNRGKGGAHLQGLEEN